MSVKTEINIKAEINVRVEDNIKAEINVRAEDNIKAEINVRAEDDIKAEINPRAEANIKAEDTVRVEDNINESNQKKIFWQFFWVEVITFFTQVVIFFIIALFLSYLPSENKWAEFLNSKLDFHNYEYGITIVVIFFILGFLTTIEKVLEGVKKLFGFKVTCLNINIIDIILLEIPRTIYLAGSGLVAAALFAAWYVFNNPNFSPKYGTQFFLFGAFVFILFFFVFGFVLKFALVWSISKRKK